MFQQKETAEDLEEVAIAYAEVAGPDGTKQDGQGQIRVPKLLTHLGLASSGAEANRKIAEKAVRIEGSVVEGLLIPASLPARLVVRLGKRAKVALIR